MSKKKFGKKKSTQIPNLTKTILDIIRKRPNQNFNYKQIASQLNITDASGRNQIIKKLSQLAAKQQIVEVDRGKFQFNGPQGLRLKFI